ncbi:substrate-binding domain-containing protein [Sediminispirochaeta bajacaliforniensis]|uniref:substrate-binding domain-containing protein n=1 Tax=Sediminispirochaeta bajacaliforniensis TaxID=148 RepID=UPI00036899D6|nr:substrate-binding domain-containing protein [Sediminispirochaeta bajacaliforniensis]
MKKVTCLISMGLILGASLFANGQQEVTVGGTKVGGYNVAYITPSLDVPFWRYIRHGIESEVKILNANSSVVTYDSKNSANTQSSNVQDAITKQVDAIIVSPTDSASCTNVLELAEDAGIPVVICDIGTDGGTYAAFISTNNKAGAKELGEYVAMKLKKGDEVAQIALNQARINGVLRKEGFNEGIATVGAVDVGFKQMEKVNRQEGETYTQDLITAHPELKAIFCHSEDPSMGCCSALESAGRTDVMVVGFDCSPDVVEAIQDGRMLATAAQQPVLMGRKAADCIDKILQGETVEKEIKMNTLLVTQDNIGSIYTTLKEVALTDE